MTHPRPCSRFRRLLVAWSLLGLLAFSVTGATASAQPTSTPTLECQPLWSSILGREVKVCVSLPAGYARWKKVRYPTLYFLHGLFENERSWGERGGHQVLEELVAKNEVGKLLVVLPDGGKSFYVNSLDGRERYEDFFILELVPAINRRYRTIPDPGTRGISGTSMGGYGALRLAMRHPDVFDSASAHSAALIPKIPNPLPAHGRWSFYAQILQGPFGSPISENYWDVNSPLKLAEHPERFANLKLYFDCGDRDRYGFEEGAQLLHQTLTQKGFGHEFALRPGDHGWSFLTQYLKFSLLFHWRYFDQAQQARTALGRDGGTR